MSEGIPISGIQSPGTAAGHLRVSTVDTENKGKQIICTLHPKGRIKVTPLEKQNDIRGIMQDKKKNTQINIERLH